MPFSLRWIITLIMLNRQKFMRLVLFINREYRSIVPFDKDYYLCHDSEITTSDLCYRLLPWHYYTSYSNLQILHYIISVIVKTFFLTTHMSIPTWVYVHKQLTYLLFSDIVKVNWLNLRRNVKANIDFGLSDLSRNLTYQKLSKPENSVNARRFSLPAFCSSLVRICHLSC